MGAASPLLSLHGLTKIFRSTGMLGSGGFVRAVDSVDLEVFPGETLGLVGESGSGKTTLARCALRLVEPSAGSVYFEGEDLQALSGQELRKKRRQFQIIFQNPASSLDPSMTVEAILMEPFEAHGIGTQAERRRRIRELLTLVALDPMLLDRRPAQLSGGQQQRIVITRALALEPRLLIADEPVSSLDASVQAQILNLLGDLQRQLGLTLVLISHSLFAVHYLCSRVAVMYLGRIIEEAETHDFFNGPLHPYSQMLLDSMPSLETGKERSIAVAEPAPAPASGCPFLPRCVRAVAKCHAEAPRLTRYGQSRKIACFLRTEKIEAHHRDTENSASCSC